MNLLKKCLIQFNNQWTNKITEKEVDNDVDLRFTLLDMQKFAEKYHTEQLRIGGVVGSEFADCIKTVVSLKDETKATVYVPNNLDATQQLNYYDELFKKVGWWTWSKVN